MPSSKRSRIQAYLDPELAEVVRLRAQEEDRAESREITRLVKLGLEADVKNYNLGGALFRTKADIQLHIRGVRDSTPLGQRVEDAAVLALMQLHPEWETKTDGGGWLGTAMIHHPSRARPTKELAICFTESSKVVDISWTKLLPLLSKGVSYIHTLDDPLAELRAAARAEIEDQVAPLRRSGYEVDHVYPKTFEALLYAWMVEQSLRVGDVVVAWNDGPLTGCHFADPVQAASWRLYHADSAVLETVSKEEHTRRTQRSKVDWSPLCDNTSTSVSECDGLVA